MLEKGDKNVAILPQRLGPLGHPDEESAEISKDLGRSKVALGTQAEAQLDKESFVWTLRNTGRPDYHGNRENNLAKTGAPADP